jgi:PAS domain S-box-containing protein
VIGVVGRELLAVRRDGSQFPIDLSVSSFGVDDELYLTGIIRDATTRKEAEAALRDSEAQQRDLLLTLGHGTFMARDPDGTIRYWAEGCERLYNWKAREAVGRSADELLGTIFPIPLSEIEATLERVGEWKGDLRHRTRDGQELTVTAHKRLRRGENGRPGIVMEALTDVTAYRRAESALRENEAATAGTAGWRRRLL